MASDARADRKGEGTRLPTGGFLAVDTVAPNDRRVGGFTEFTQEHLDVWGGIEHPIEVAEAAMPAVALKHLWWMMSNRTVVLYLDNTPSLHALLRGTSANAAVDGVTQLIHFLLVHYRARLRIEWVLG